MLQLDQVEALQKEKRDMQGNTDELHREMRKLKSEISDLKHKLTV